MGYKYLLPAFCVGVVTAFFLAEHGSWGVWVACWCGAAVVCVGAYLRQWHYWGQGLACVLCLLTGLMYSLWRTDTVLQNQVSAEVGRQAVMMDIEVIGLPEQRVVGGRRSSRFVGKGMTEDGREYRLLFYDYAGLLWQTGERWRIKARIRAPLSVRNPVGFDREVWALANGINGLASVGKGRVRLPNSKMDWLPNADVWRARISSAWQRAAEDEPYGAGLMQALAVGNRSGLPPEVWAAFRPLGLNHLVSISGLHISMVALLAALLTKYLMRFLPRVPIRPRMWQLVVGIAAALIYTGLAGFGVPAVRSLLMLCVFAWAWIRRGMWSMWRVWWTALTAVLLLQPTSVLSVGFWLSFGLVGTLVWALAFRLPEHRFIQAVRGQWAVTLVGGIGAVYFFGTLPIFSPLVNAVAIPFFSWILVPLALVASISPFDFARDAAAFVGGKTVDVLLWLGERLPDVALSHAPAPVLWLALVCAFLLLLPRGGRWKPLACCGVAMFVLYRPSAPVIPLTVYVWDVGQGLSVLIQTRSQNVLFDTGKPGAELSLLPNLRALGIDKLDAMILSHHDDDHDGGYTELVKSLAIKKLWGGQPEFYPNAEYCADGKRWDIDGVVFEFLTPLSIKTAKDNDKSCVLRVVADGQAVLMTGDLGIEGEMALMREYGDLLYSPLLILGHHGSKYSSGKAFLRAVDPKIAVASSGFANAFKHPHPDVLTRLADLGIKLMRTDQQGALVFRFSGGEMSTSVLMTDKKWWQRKPF